MASDYAATRFTKREIISRTCEAFGARGFKMAKLFEYEPHFKMRIVTVRVPHRFMEEVVGL